MGILRWALYDHIWKCQDFLWQCPHFSGQSRDRPDFLGHSSVVCRDSALGFRSVRLRLFWLLNFCLFFILNYFICRNKLLKGYLKVTLSKIKYFIRFLALFQRYRIFLEHCKILVNYFVQVCLYFIVSQ